MFHRNLRSDHTPSKTLRSDHANLRNDHVPPVFESICHILVEHGCINFLMEHGRFEIFLMEHGRFSNLVEHGHINFLMEHGRFSNFLMEHGRFSNFSMEHGHFSNFSMKHGHFSIFCGAWSFLVISIFFWWSMVVSQILVEHGHFLRKLLIADKQAQKSSVPPKFEAICHILVEHNHFYFLMEHGHSSNFGGTWSFFKFWWNRVNF